MDKVRGRERNGETWIKREGEREIESEVERVGGKEREREKKRRVIDLVRTIFCSLIMRSK